MTKVYCAECKYWVRNNAWAFSGYCSYVLREEVKHDNWHSKVMQNVCPTAEEQNANNDCEYYERVKLKPS